MKIETCTDCTGRGDVPNPNAGERRPCYVCAGHGVSNASGGAYKTAATADKGRASGKARRCWSCSGEGLSRPAPDRERCWPCHGTGVHVTSARPGDVLPDAVGITDTVPKPVMRELADLLTVRVSLQNREGTWNEAHLGLGAIVSVTDYGRTWDRFAAAASDADAATLTGTIDTFREEIREMVAEDYMQWCKIADRETRVIGDVVAAMVHRNGYTVVSMASAAMRPVLPPTYTAEVLNAPIR